MTQTATTQTATTRTAIITGGGRGIGRAVATRLAEDGWQLVLAGRSADALDTAVAELTASGHTAVGRPTDVTDEAQVEHLFDDAVDTFGRIDLLFNNAGISAPAVPIDELPVETWTAVVNTNLTGAFLCARAAFARMRQQTPTGGRIINNGSISSMTPRPFSVAYTATKHAITGLTKTLALDGRAWDITAGQIDIGNASSDMADSMAAGALQPDGSTKPEPLMPVSQVADAVAQMAALPLSTNVLSMTIMATKMPFVGRG